MAEWRYLRRWTDDELAERLAALDGLGRNFRLDEEMSPRRGWNVIHSHAVVAREAVGPPVAGGPFERLWVALRHFHHSDPRIVLAHFRKDAPLEERDQLLELSALGLRYLCPVRIGATREATGDASTLRGFALDTLDGHIERGREWFYLDKDHVTGEVRFRIEAIWQPGDFPTAWSQLGFHMVGRRYQRAWHRLAHLRLRRIAAGLDPDETFGPGGLVHEGPPIPSEPVQFFAQRGLGRRGVDVEQEQEDMRRDRMWRAIALGALAGVRSAGAPAVLVGQLERRGKDVWSGHRARRRFGVPLAVLAAAEGVADKLPITPARTAPPSLAARALAGAFVGSATARKRESKLAPAVLGAAAATAATFASYRIRQAGIRRSKALGYAVAVAEDALVFWAGTRLARTTARATATLAT